MNVTPLLNALAGRPGLDRTILDALPSPVFLVDEDVRILDFNAAAGGLLGEEKGIALQKRGGEALHCLNAHQSEGGCGRAPVCKECVIRNSVGEVFRGAGAHRRATRLDLARGGQSTAVHILVTAAPLRYDGVDLAVLVLEDVTDLMLLKRLVPICSYCRKIRDDGEFWQRVEVYFKRTMDIDFSHGICPECFERVKAEMKSQQPGLQAAG